METDPHTHRLAVIGAGVMGTNIAALAVGHGVPTVLIDLDSDILARAELTVEQHLRHASLLGALPEDRQRGGLITGLAVADAAGATAVIEAITELPDAKAKVLTELSTAIRPGTPIVSNTSGIPISELAEWVERPADLVGTHFMNPTYLIEMVEVIRGTQTGEATMTAVTTLLETMRRRPVVVRDAPGFVTSRLLHPMINTAARILDEGTADAEAVDTLMQGCLGHPTGPLRTADLIGIDNLVDSLVVLHQRTGDESCRPAEALLAKVRAGHLGRKSGRGFYAYGKAVS